eukprot:m.203318 g.203318  ORF g.203318 m.203318 type:complete len:92 (+) comp39621_c2_seq5:1457-1732(+)
MAMSTRSTTRNRADEIESGDEGNSSRSQRTPRRLPATPQLMPLRQISGLPTPGPLKTKGNLPQHWRDFKQLWESFRVVQRLNLETGGFCHV